MASFQRLPTRLLACLLLANLFWFSPAVSAAPQLGKEYSIVPQPQPTDTQKIEVQEIFSYACSHCFDLEPVITRWAKKLPKDAQFVQLHAATNPKWLALSKLYYTLESLGESERLNADAFNAIHLKDINLTDEKIATEWATKQGIDSKKFTETYASFGVQSKVERSKRLTTAYGISGVPSIVVGGKYLTSASMAGSHEAALRVVEHLIGLVRQERGGKK